VLIKNPNFLYLAMKFTQTKSSRNNELKIDMISIRALFEIDC